MRLFRMMIVQSRRDRLQRSASEALVTGGMAKITSGGSPPSRPSLRRSRCSRTRITGRSTLVYRLRSSLVDRCHQISRSGLLDHMASACNAVHLALLDFVMQPGGLFVNID